MTRERAGAGALALALSALLLAAAPAAAGPAASSSSKAGPRARSAARTDWRGDGGREKPEAVVIEDAKAWAELWKELKKPAPPPPDFERQAAVAAFAGSRPTGGWGIVFLPVVLEPGRLVVRFRVLPPSPDAFVTQAFTRPWAVRVLAREGRRVDAAFVP